MPWGRNRQRGGGLADFWSRSMGNRFSAGPQPTASGGQMGGYSPGGGGLGAFTQGGQAGAGGNAQTSPYGGGDFASAPAFASAGQQPIGTGAPMFGFTPGGGGLSAFQGGQVGAGGNAQMGPAPGASQPLAYSGGLQSAGAQPAATGAQMTGFSPGGAGLSAFQGGGQAGAGGNAQTASLAAMLRPFLR